MPGRAAIMAAVPEDRSRLLATLLGDKVARVLGTTADRLDVERPLLELGVDSLMAVELRNWLEGELQVDLPIVDLMRSPCLSRLAEVLARRLETGGELAAREVGKNGTAHRIASGRNGQVNLADEEAPMELLARIDDLSGDEVDSLLAALVEEKGAGNGR